MTRYGEITNPLVTPQSEAARPEQSENHAGGFVFQIDKWKQLDRFLILGQVGPTYYATERAGVKENADVIRACIAENGERVVQRILGISDAGRAPKNDPAIFALALAASAAKDARTRAIALSALPKICRIGTHLFHFAADVKANRGWGRGLAEAVARWYTSRSDDELAMQAIKYPQRDGWAHRDLLRLSHPVPKGPTMNATFRWMIGGAEALGKEKGRSKRILLETLHPDLVGYDQLHAAEDLSLVLRLIQRHEFPREAIPTKWLNRPEVWEALLPHMGITAMIRNLGKMTAVGLLSPLSEAAKHVTTTIMNVETIRKGRVHPMQFLVASGVYTQGHGDKGKLAWTPERSIRDALDAGFYQAFATVEPTGKNTLIALDISGSMDGGLIAGCPGISPRVAAGAMAMVTARAETNWHMIGFTSGWGRGRQENGISRIDIAKNERIEAVCQKMRGLPMGNTDCAAPMLYAMHLGLDVDTFQIYTDNETWAGSVHPFQALRMYRQKSGRPARCVVVGLTATQFSIADPSDAGMLDVVGFDSHAPALMASFSRGDV